MSYWEWDGPLNIPSPPRKLICSLSSTLFLSPSSAISPPSPEPPPSVLSKSLSCVHPSLFFSFSPYFFYLYRFLHAKIAVFVLLPLLPVSFYSFSYLFFPSLQVLPPLPLFFTQFSGFTSLHPNLCLTILPPLPLLHPYLWEQNIDVIDWVSQVIT